MTMPRSSSRSRTPLSGPKGAASSCAVGRRPRMMSRALKPHSSLLSDAIFAADSLSGFGIALTTKLRGLRPCAGSTNSTAYPVVSRLRRSHPAGGRNPMLQPSGVMRGPSEIVLRLPTVRMASAVTTVNITRAHDVGEPRSLRNWNRFSVSIGHTDASVGARSRQRLTVGAAVLTLQSAVGRDPGVRLSRNERDEQSSHAGRGSAVGMRWLVHGFS